MSTNNVVFRVNTGGRPIAELNSQEGKLQNELIGVFKSKVSDVRPDPNEVRTLSEILAPGMKRYIKSNNCNIGHLNLVGVHLKKKKSARDDSHKVQRHNLSVALRDHKLCQEEEAIRKTYQPLDREGLLRAKNMYMIATMEINLLLCTSEHANPMFHFEECIVQITEELNAERHAEMLQPPTGESQGDGGDEPNLA
jgi:hypothetical protein